MTFTITAWAADGRTVKTITGPVNPQVLDNGFAPWEASEDRILIEMVKFGFGHGDIAVHLKRSADDVRERMKELRNKQQ
jgi:hypothetical protein